MFSLPVLIARGLDLQYAGTNLAPLASLFSFQGASKRPKLDSKPSASGFESKRKRKRNEMDVRREADEME